LFGFVHVAQVLNLAIFGVVFEGEEGVTVCCLEFDEGAYLWVILEDFEEEERRN
jgi:hypothetical protein